MSFNFDSMAEDGYGVPETFSSEEPTIIEELEESEHDEEDDDTGFEEEVENRLAIANCFRSLLENDLFASSDKITRFVERKVRRFVRTELEILLGMRQREEPKSHVSQFTDEEVAALKTLAAKVLSRSNGGGAPVVQPVVLQAPPSPATLTVNKKNVAPKSVVPNKTETKTATPKKTVRSKAKTSKEALKKESPEKESPEKEAGGRDFAIFKATAIDETGKVVEKDIKIDLKTQTKPPGYVPPAAMSAIAQEQMYAMAAQQSLSNLMPREGGDGGFESLLSAAISKSLENG